MLIEEIESLKAQGHLQDDAMLRISEEAHLIMPYHKAIDQARERLRGEGMIGTTGRGIGPAYEDKVRAWAFASSICSKRKRFRKNCGAISKRKTFICTPSSRRRPSISTRSTTATRPTARSSERYVTNTSLLLDQQIARRQEGDV